MAEIDKKISKEESEDILTLDYNNLAEEVIGGGRGLNGADLQELKPLLAAAFKDVERRYKKGALPFMDLPKET